MDIQIQDQARVEGVREVGLSDSKTSDPLTENGKQGTEQEKRKEE